MQHKDMRRALRRHHRARLIAKRTSPAFPYWGRAWMRPLDRFTPLQTGKLARTPKPCGCWMCGNPRRVFRDLPPRERSDREAVKRGVV